MVTEQQDAIMFWKTLAEAIADCICSNKIVCANYGHWRLPVILCKKSQDTIQPQSSAQTTVRAVARLASQDRRARSRGSNEPPRLNLRGPQTRSDNLCGPLAIRSCQLIFYNSKCCGCQACTKLQPEKLLSYGSAFARLLIRHRPVAFTASVGSTVCVQAASRLRPE